MRAVASLMPGLTALATDKPLTEEFAMVTVTHAEMGAPAFGIAPGQAEIWATLRTLTDTHMEGLCAKAEALARGTAHDTGLGVEISYADIFAHCENSPVAVAHLSRALDQEGVAHDRGNLPMRASEDFGRFEQRLRRDVLFRRRRKPSRSPQSRL